MFLYENNDFYPIKDTIDKVNSHRLYKDIIFTSKTHRGLLSSIYVEFLQISTNQVLTQRKNGNMLLKCSS